MSIKLVDNGVKHSNKFSKGHNHMFKKFSIILLIVTVVILPLNFADNLFGTTVFVAEAAASDFTDGKKIDFIEKIETGETGNYDSVWTKSQGQSKAGTVIFKI